MNASKLNKLEYNYTEENMKVPKEKLPFKNKMWSYINDLVNSNYEGSNTQYNDLLQFEKHFEEWDHDGILLLEISYGPKNNSMENLPYVYIRPIGVFTNLNNVGRRLQSIFSYYGYTDINVITTGGELDFTVSVDDKISTRYNLRCIDIDQRNSDNYFEGIKYEILDNDTKRKLDQMQVLLDYIADNSVDKDRKNCFDIPDAINNIIKDLENYNRLRDLKKSPGV